MKIALAQIKSYAGDIDKNLKNHIFFLETAIAEKVELIVFPELSLTNYEPTLAKTLAMSLDDPLFDPLQELCDQNGIVIGIGLPLKKEVGIGIGTLFLQPQNTRKSYVKQELHPDEMPYFCKGDNQILLNIGNQRIAPAICFESLLESHIIRAYDMGADIYLASVAKSRKGLEKAFEHYPKMAKKYSMTILMVNSIGNCDDFVAAGQSSVWNHKGELLGTLEREKQGIIIWDLDAQVFKKIVFD